jgi:hypothetical protein
MKTYIERHALFSYLFTAWDTFFLSPTEKKNILLRSIFLLFLYIFGIYLWGKTFSWGGLPLDYFDWALINTPRIDFVRDALNMGVLPLHMEDT